MVTFTGNSVDDTATYSCNMGFEQIGNATVTCTQVDVNSAVFSPAPPVCRRKQCMNMTRVLYTFSVLVIDETCVLITKQYSQTNPF